MTVVVNVTGVPLSGTVVAGVITAGLARVIVAVWLFAGELEDDCSGVIKIWFPAVFVVSLYSM